VRVVHDAVGAANQMLATRTVAVVSLACVSRAGSSIGSSTGFCSSVRGGGGHQRYRAGAPVWRLYGPAPSGGSLGCYYRTRFRGRLGGAQRKPSRIAGPSIRVAEVRVPLGAHLLVFSCVYARHAESAQIWYFDPACRRLAWSNDNGPASFHGATGLVAGWRPLV